MSKKDIQLFGKIIDKKIKEIDQSRVTVQNTMTLEETIERIKEMCQFEEDKTVMNQMIKTVITNWEGNEDGRDSI